MIELVKKMFTDGSGGLSVLLVVGVTALNNKLGLGLTDTQVATIAGVAVAHIGSLWHQSIKEISAGPVVK